MRAAFAHLMRCALTPGTSPRGPCPPHSLPYSHAALPATTDRQYELVLMLDPEVEDDQRDKIAADARSRIESDGTLKHDESWGMRKMAYDIRQRTEADYRFYRFVGEKPLLDALDHNLK